MIGFDDIVQIFDLPMREFPRASAFGLQFRNSNTIGRSLVGVDDGGLLPVLQAIQGLAQKALCRFGIAGRER